MRTPERRRGIAVLMTAVMIIGVMSIIGLAVDVGMMYAIHTKLSAAVDGAALAGARAANLGNTAMQDTAQAYFDANIPQGYMLASTAAGNKIRVVVGAPTTSGSITSMTITGYATLPLLFLRLVNPSTDIQVSATSQRRNVNLVVVLDGSSSMNSGSPTACSQMRLAAQDFTDQFVDGRDKLGVIVFGGSWDATYPMSKTFKSGSPTVNSKIASLVCSGNTGSAQAIWQAYQWLKTNPDAAGAINAMVFFTDGQPNGLTANWPISTAAALTAAAPGATGTPSYANSSGGNAGVTTSSTSPWTLAYGPSGCSAAVTVGGIPTIRGFIARWGENQHGIHAEVAQSAGVDGAIVSNQAGCAFASATNDAHGLNGGNRVHEDVPYIPATDVYGNSTTGYWDNAATVPGCGNTNFIKISGAVSAANPYGGKPLLDHYTSGAASSGSPCGLLDNNIDLASANAAEDAAYRARTDATYPVTVFSIGLGGAADIAPPQFLKHVANTIDSDLKASHSNEPIGKYVFVNGPGQLGAAFQEIASYVQRLSQ